MKNIFRKAMGFALVLSILTGGLAFAQTLIQIPQIDSSTARIPITDAIYAYFAKEGAAGPLPMCSKTHGAWLNLADGKADILFLVAPTADEMRYFADAGVDIEMKIYGYDGLVFLGNASNTVNNITSQEIRSIYRGDITGWWGVSDSTADGDIVVYIRNPESGSQRLFENLVWTGYDMPDFQSQGFLEGEVAGASPYKTEEFDDMSDITLNVMQNRFSIGYNIMSYVDNVFLSDEVQKPKVVTTGNANLRDLPELAGEIVATVPSGTEFEYTGYTRYDERDVAWHSVLFNDDSAWVSSRYSELHMDNSALKLFNIDGYAPTTENFANGNYPFVTTSYVAIRAGEPSDSPARRLYDWIGSEASREIIEANSTLSVGFSDSVVINAQAGNPARKEVGEIIDTIAERTLSREELYAFTQDELAYVWQGCCARAGKLFSQAKYKEYFAAKEWYNPSLATYLEAFNHMDAGIKANLELISAYLDDLRRATAATAPRTFSYSYYEDGMEGDDVLELQRALEQLGLLKNEECTGKYDQNSANAIKTFQEDNGLEGTGIFDATTRMMLL